MFLLFGNRISENIVNVVVFVCHFCRQQAPQNVIRTRNRFTLFFIPLFTFSTKYVNECTNCGGRTALSSQQAQHSLEWAENKRQAT